MRDSSEFNFFFYKRIVPLYKERILPIFTLRYILLQFTGKLVTKVYHPSKMVLASLPPAAVTVSQEVKKSVQPELPKTLFPGPVSMKLWL